MWVFGLGRTAAAATAVRTRCQQRPTIAVALLWGTATRHKTYSITGEGRGAAARLACRTHTLLTDVPRAMGGCDAAPQPVELLLAALVGCETATAAYVARQMRPRIRLKKISFDCAAERDELGALALPLETLPPVPSQLQRINGIATVHLVDGCVEPPERIKELQEHVEQRCPIANMVRNSGCHLDVQWVLARPSESVGS
mmetsp:Transcript_112000/g.311839  ORF Transcript_112000/g.311839 Transcript_112000/m.311839 type:complete len:200 (-) Transcript_112000:85-684(-)